MKARKNNTEINILTVKYCLIFTVVCLYSISCKGDKPFDKQKWMTKDDMEYPFRNDMLKDLTLKHQLKGIKYSKLIDLLGEPQYQDSINTTYLIKTHYSGIDPAHGKQLVFLISKDSTVTSYSINEWKK
ncbi:hypothetical protein [Sediminibacterium sp.]|jgi:hypothetical protein|uniref:hypothetical protein n=1 Tax=Sediminibacterium sp. TaxID=1917865 RepID=UPI0025F3CD5B|nr:hypothetical protein [Sediminibacterium sp.]MBT9484950.1 hypothetical protein [Sediminibacterium sp.]